MGKLDAMGFHRPDGHPVSHITTKGAKASNKDSRGSLSIHIEVPPNSYALAFLNCLDDSIDCLIEIRQVTGRSR